LNIKIKDNGFFKEYTLFQMTGYNKKMGKLIFPTKTEKRMYICILERNELCHNIKISWTLNFTYSTIQYL